MRSVALLGGAETTRGACKDSRADEFWTINWAYKYDWVPRIDRLFEMHPIWLYQNTVDKPEWRKPREHWEWLKQEHPYPVYMLRDLPGVPSCVRYPIEAVTEDIFGRRLLRNEEPSDFYTSSLDYLMGLAIHEKWDVIELYGFEMGSATEYRYQREGATFFIGVALGRDITVKRQPNSVLLRAKRYGYEGGQMIFRQDLEQAFNKYAEMRRDLMAKLQHMEGQAAACKDDVPQELAQALQSARDMAAIAAGAYQAVEYLIRHVDLEEPEIELTNPFEILKL